METELEIELFERMQDGYDWYMENRRMLERKYPGKWVAVSGKMVVQGDSHEAIIERLKTTRMDQRDDVMVFLIPDNTTQAAYA